MKRNNRFTKRFLALFLALCFVLGQMNLPAGLIKISPDFSFLHTKAAGETFTYNITANSTVNDIPFTFTATFQVTDAGKVAMVGTNSTGLTGGNGYIVIPDTVTYNSTTYQVDSIGLKGSKLDVFQGQTALDSITIPDSVTAICDQAFSACTSLVDVKIGENSKLEYIGEAAFQGCFSRNNNIDDKYKETALKLSLPATIQTIGTYAFRNCAYLKEVFIADGANVTLEKNAFAGLTNLTTVTLPDTTVSIGEDCFNGCTELKTIGTNIPSALDTIPARAFYDCNNLEIDTIKFSTNIKSIGEQCFFRCRKIGQADFSKSSVEAIPKGAFQSSGVTNIIFNDTINTIGESAFESCSSLCQLDSNYVTDLNFPSSLTVIEKAAFKGCSKIGRINWTDGTKSCNITRLGESAFEGCSNIDNLVIPKSLTEIPDRAFYGCSHMGRLSVPVTVTSIGNYAFSNCTNLSVYFNYTGVADTPTDTEIENKTSTFLPSELASIGAYAFAKTSIVNFEIPKKVTRINDRTFSECTELKTVKLHDNIQLIGSFAFYGCSLLEESTANNTTFTIPANVEAIGNNAFNGCSVLQKVVFADGSKITDITKASSLFAGCTKLTEVTLPSAITALPSDIFSGNTALKTVHMAGATKLTAINNNCFKDCAAFTGFNGDTSGKLTLPSTLKTLGSSAFEGCGSITVADLGNTTVTTINPSTFKNTGLNTVKFPRTLTNIDAEAFIGCMLTSLTFQNTQKVATIANTAFKSKTGESYLDTDCKFTVPAGLVDDYYNTFSNLGFNFLKTDFTGVTIASTSITLSIDGADNLIVGKDVKVNITQDGSEGYHLESSNNQVVKADGSTIHPLKIGTATITAISTSGARSEAVKVTVKPSSGAASYVKDPITTITPDTTTLGTRSTTYNATQSTFFVGETKDIIIQTGIGTGATNAAESDSLTWTLEPAETDSGANFVSNGYIRIDYQQPSNGTAKATITALAYTPATIKAMCASSCTSTNITINISPTYDAIVPRNPTASTKLVTNTIDAKNYFNFTTPSPEKLTWSSSNPAVATINEEGKITCVAPGQTTINVSSEVSNRAASVILTVANDITKVATTDNKTSYTVLAGQPLTFTANVTYDNPSMSSPDTLTWTSSNEEVAKVIAVPNGASYTVSVTTLKAGSASIIGTSSTGKKFTFSISAGAARFEKTSFSLYTAGPNKKATIKPQGSDGKALPSDASISYKMADSKSGKIASVSSSGAISGKKAGSAKVTVTVYGVPYNIDVNVTKATLGVSISGATPNKKQTQYKISKKAKKATLSYSANYLGSVKKKVSYKSSKKSVATISKKGVIKLKKKGTTKITVTVNGVKKTFKLKVVK